MPNHRRWSERSGDLQFGADRLGVVAVVMVVTGMRVAVAGGGVSGVLLLGRRQEVQGIEGAEELAAIGLGIELADFDAVFLDEVFERSANVVAMRHQLHVPDEVDDLEGFLLGVGTARHREKRGHLTQNELRRRNAERNLAFGFRHWRSLLYCLRWMRKLAAPYYRYISTSNYTIVCIRISDVLEAVYWWHATRQST